MACGCLETRGGYEIEDGVMPIVEFAIGGSNKRVRFHSYVAMNRHGSARAAANAWLAGSLWGNPIELSPNCIHVYGVWRRDWSLVDVCFSTRQIWVIKPLTRANK